MPEPFPEFSEPNPLPDGRSWTAEFDEYDMRHDDAYYFVTLGDGSPGFFARVWVDGGVPDRAHLAEQLAKVAATGKANTETNGSFGWQLRHP